MELLNLNQKVKKDSQADKLAKEIMLFADDNGAAISLQGFQEKQNCPIGVSKNCFQLTGKFKKMLKC